MSYSHSHRLLGIRLVSGMATTGALLFSLLVTQVSFGQATDAAETDEVMEEVVVVGTRALPRSVEDSSVPIDSISSEDFENQVGSDMTNLVRALVPSFHVSDNPSRDLAALLRPVNLRGLAPDHTLVLLNNKRRHRGSVIQWISNGASNGAQGPDISAIPAIAIERMEVLRDGAAAQYGSDAIAGVLNFVLKDASEGAMFESKYGFHTAESGEDMSSLAGNIGLPLADTGFANLSFEYADSASTDRSVQHRDATALIGLGIPNVGVPAKPWGSPKVSGSIKAVANVGFDLSADQELYGVANYATREVETAFFFRSPMNRNGVYKTSDNIFLVGGDGCQEKYNVPSTAENLLSFISSVSADSACFSFVELYPEGFTPAFGATVSDYSMVGGIKGELPNGLLYDVSASIGENNMDGFLNNSLNPSLGPSSQRDFEIGQYTQTETNLNADFSYPVDVGMASDLNVAGGYEWREEEFQISTGEQASWQIGPYQQYGFGTGSNGFGGFNPASSGTWARANVAAYLDLEVNVTDQWRVGTAVRWEDFDGFGDTLNYKLASHLRLTDAVALRGSYGTGFRAPTPGQSNARNVSTVVNAATNAFEERGTIGATHPVAMALGGRELQPEESGNLTLGVVVSLVNGLSITADYYRIRVDDRIALSGLFDVTDEIKSALVAAGVPEASEFTSVRYFANDFDTKTSGVDVVLTYGWESEFGSTDLLFSANRTTTHVRDFREGSTITGGDTIDNLERGSPESRFNINLTHSKNEWYGALRYSYFGPWYDDHSAAEFDGYGLADLLVQRDLENGVVITVGAENFTDTYPEESVNLGNGRKYPRYSPAGHNGTLLYAKVSYSM